MGIFRRNRHRRHSVTGEVVRDIGADLAVDAALPAVFRILGAGARAIGSGIGHLLS